MSREPKCTFKPILSLVTSSLINGDLRANKENYDMRNIIFLNEIRKSGAKVRYKSSVVFEKITVLLPEVPQLLFAQAITRKLLLEMQDKINKAPLSIQKVFDKNKCVILIIRYLRCLNEFNNTLFKNIYSIYDII